jgi:hypothetical protein
MSEVTSDYLRKRGITIFDFLGIKYVSDFAKWSDFKELNLNFTLRLPEKGDINRIAFEVKQGGSSGEGMGTLQRLTGLIDEATKTQTVLFALTELSVLFNTEQKYFANFAKKSGKVYLDTLTILAEHIADLCTREEKARIEKAKKVAPDDVKAAQTLPEAKSELAAGEKT